MNSHYQNVLRSQFERGTKPKPPFSLRGFASRVGMDAGGLSRIASGKKALSIKGAKKILPHLKLSPPEEQMFLQSVVEDQLHRKIESEALEVDTQAVGEIEQESFRVISELYHSALIELTHAKDFDPTPTAIATRLGITPVEAQLGLDRLVRLGYLKRSKGKYVASSNFFSVKDKELTMPALKQQTREILRRAARALDYVPLEKRANNNITMVINPDKLPIAKKMIVEMSRKICSTLETGNRTKAYQLTVQLFPLEKV